MSSNLFKQFFWAFAFLALAFFVLDIHEFYENFNPEKYKLSIWEISKEFLTLSAKSSFFALILLRPILAINIVTSILKSYRLHKLGIFFCKSYTFVISSIVLLIILINRFISLELISVEALRDLIYPVNIKSYVFVSVVLLCLFVSLVSFKKDRSKRIFNMKKRSKTFLVLSLTLLTISILHMYRPLFKTSKQDEVLDFVIKIVESRKVKLTKIKVEGIKVDYQKEFKNYLGLESLFEDEENYINLLKRRTTKKEKELSVVFIFANDIELKTLIDNLRYPLYTFKKSILNYSKPKDAVRSIKMNIPAVININQSDRDDHSLPSYYKQPLKGYELEDERKRNFERFGAVDQKSFKFYHLDQFSKGDVLSLNKTIESNEKNLVVAITGSSIEKKKTNDLRRLLIDRSTFVSFYIPKQIEPEFFNAQKIVGQEDIMTTLYNLALSEREYLSLGDDLFTDSNTNAINEDLYADQRGVIYNDKYLSFASSEKKSISNKEDLKQRYKTIKNISEYILMISKKRTNLDPE